MITKKTKISILSIPDAMVSSMGGMFDVLSSLPMLTSFSDAIPDESPFVVEIVARDDNPAPNASGLPISPHRILNEVDDSDIVIIPSVLVAGESWETGRYPREVAWLQLMHEQGATIYSACSGVLLLAETGLLDELEATVHWAYASTFRSNYPIVDLKVEEILVASGARKEFVMCGASASWHDLVLYLVTRHLGATAAHAIMRFFLLQWHSDGQSPYTSFTPETDHGDAAILDLQNWLSQNFAEKSPVEKLLEHSNLPERTMKRRFRNATGLAPITYVQQLRVEDAKRRLERTETPIDHISEQVGYEDPAYFRRLFKKSSGITPADYRRKFRVPELPLPN